MRPGPLCRLSFLAAVAAMLVTVAVGLSMARPWSGMPPYDGPAGFLMLAALLAWACSPMLWLAFRSRRSSPGPSSLLRLVTVLLLGVGGAALMIDAAFIHIDPQSGLVMLFLPIYQWLGVGLSEALGAVLDRKNHRANAGD